MITPASIRPFGVTPYRLRIGTGESPARPSTIVILRKIGGIHPQQEARFLNHLAAGEVLMSTGMAQSVDAAKAMGRGKGEGWLFLTNRSLLHWIDGNPAPWACFDLDHCQFRSSWIVMPGLRLLKVDSSSVGHFDFYTSPRMCRTVESSKKGLG